MGLLATSERFWSAQDAFVRHLLRAELRGALSERRGIGRGVTDADVEGALAAGEQLRRVRSPGSISRKLGIWDPARRATTKRGLLGGRSSGAVTVQGGRVVRDRRVAWGVRVDEDLQREVLRLAEGLAPRLTQALDQHLGAVAFAAWREWPVDTGLSRALLDLEYTLEPGGRLRATVASRAIYTMFIQSQPHRMLERGGQWIRDAVVRDALADLVR